MPYITQKQRNTLNKSLDESLSINTPGELNYLITVICLIYLRDNNLKYQTINDIIGALDCAKMEFYRRVVVDYENEKIKINGDVFSKEK